MPHRRHAHRRRALALVSDDQLPDVRIDGVATVPMTDDQHAAAVHALAALIDTWRTTQVRPSAAEPGKDDQPFAA
jgi:hypothetical protein